MMDLNTTVSLAKALGHPARLRVLALLGDGELCLCQLVEVLALAPSTVSKHVAELRRAALVDERPDGRWRHIRLHDAPASQPWIERALADLDGDPQIRRDRLLASELRAIGAEKLCAIGLDAARGKTNK
jgi:DNA-binding transcriptional ArsR family regulator